MRDSKGRLTEAGYGDSHYRPAGCLIWCTPARTTPYPQTSSGGITKGLAVTYRVSRRFAIMGQWDGTSLGKTEGFQRTGESIFRVTTGTYATLAAEVASFSLIPMLVLGPNSRIGVGPEVNSVKVRHRDDAGERTENQTRGGLVALATVTTPPWQRMFVAFTLEHHWAGAAVVDPYTVRSSRAGPAAVGRSTIALNRTAGRIGVGIKW